MLPMDSAPCTDTQLPSTNHRESENTAASLQLPSTNQTTTTGTYEDSIISTLSNVVSKVERLNAQSRKEINRSHRLLLNNIHTDLLLLKEELKVHREQQTAQSEKRLKLLEESNTLKKIKLQLMREKKSISCEDRFLLLPAQHWKLLLLPLSRSPHHHRCQQKCPKTYLGPTLLLKEPCLL
ncbi:unnamed protein product, partial [Staurois parvus]